MSISAPVSPVGGVTKSSPPESPAIPASDGDGSERTALDAREFDPVAANPFEQILRAVKDAAEVATVTNKRMESLAASVNSMSVRMDAIENNKRFLPVGGVNPRGRMRNEDLLDEYAVRIDSAIRSTEQEMDEFVNDLNAATHSRMDKQMLSAAVDHTGSHEQQESNAEVGNASFRATFQKIPKKRESIFSHKPAYDHIVLKNLDIPSVLEWTKKAHDYMARYQCTLPLANLVHETVKGTITFNFARYGLTFAVWNALDEENVLAYIQMFCQPTTVMMFRKYLVDYCQFKWYDNGEPLTQSNFKKFHAALMDYTTRFDYLYNFLVEGNSANSPKIDKKEGGVIKIFLSKIPNGYISRMLMDERKTYASWRSFFQDFQRQTLAQYEIHKLCQSQNLLFEEDLLTGSKASTVTKKAPYKDKEFGGPREREISVSNFTPKQPASNPVKYYHSQQRPKLNVVEETSIHYDSDEIDARVRELEDPDSDIDMSAAESEATSDDGDTPAEVTSQAISVLERPKSASAATPTRIDYSQEPCTSTILEGKCLKKGCTRSHDKPKLMEGWKKLYGKLEKSKYAPMGFIPRGTFSMLEGDEFDRIAGDSNRSLKAMAKIILPSASLSVRALFDTGANSANYISANFLEENSRFLSSIIRECNTSVTLGDSATHLPISRSVTLTLEFLDSTGHTHILTDKFFVIPHRSHDIIIGLPAMTQKLFRFFNLLFEDFRNSQDSMVSTESNLSVMEGEIIPPPWAEEIVIEAPEEQDTYIPSNFPDQLAMMEQNFEELYSDFMKLLPSHVDPDFAANTPIMKYMQERGHLAFIPRDWTGINGIPKLKLKFSSDMPKIMKPRIFPVNPKILDIAHKEFQRLLKYFYVKSTSPISSPLVIAPKDTAPFIRFCGGYVEVNKFLEPNQETIPQVRYLLEKIVTYRVFHDLDLRNAFHQIALEEETSEKLSVSTPWGEYRPLFMPEGIRTATGTLQSVVNDVFEPCLDWSIAIFDNILCLAYDYMDAYNKLVEVCELCIKRNLYLKLEKSWMGMRSVKFFGYSVTEKGFTLTDDRKDAIASMPFPTNTKQAQRFLGMALYFSTFIPNYQILAAPLYELTHKDFNWKEDTWTKDYCTLFEDFKKMLYTCWVIHFPDYTLNWILRTDASDIGVGAVLFQERIKEDPGATPELEPIAVMSHKFSPQAQKWSVIEKEGFAIYLAVKKLSYFLLGKFFLLQTDHQNLLWMNQSQVAKVIRWKCFLQQYYFLVQHISGKLNVAADCLSRSLLELMALSHEDMLSQAHTYLNIHRGIRRTYLKLCQLFPGNDITMEEVRNYVSDCATCQKTRFSTDGDIHAPVYRHLHVDHPYAAVGFDHLAIAPDKHGNVALVVIVNLFTKYVWLAPVSEYTAIALARILFRYFSIFGIISSIHSDPGSAMTSEVIRLLSTWMNVKQVFSLVDWHTSCGVEASNREILRHLQAIVHDRRVKDNWSSDEVLSLVMFHLNSEVHSETGFSPMELTFGSVAAVYHSLPTEASDKILSHEYLQSLNRSLLDVTAASKSYQDSLVVKRKTTDAVKEYAPGDYVLTLNTSKGSKLEAKYLGPYVVVQQVKNDVTCRHLAVGTIHVFHVSNLKSFHGSRTQAYDAAMRDHDQFIISHFISYRGDPLHRKSVEFLVAFGDGSTVWVPYSSDLFDSVPYETFCRSLPQLLCLVHAHKESLQLIASINSSPITEMQPGDTTFFDLRGWGEAWYTTLELPNLFETTYLFEAVYEKWLNKQQTKIMVYIPVLKQRYRENHYRVFAYGNIRSLVNLNHKIIDLAMLNEYKQLKQLRK